MSGGKHPSRKNNTVSYILVGTHTDIQTYIETDRCQCKDLEDPVNPEEIVDTQR